MIARSRSVNCIGATMDARLNRGRRNDSIPLEYRRRAAGEVVRVCASGQCLGCASTIPRLRSTDSPVVNTMTLDVLSCQFNVPRINIEPDELRNAALLGSQRRVPDAQEGIKHHHCGSQSVNLDAVDG